MSWILRDELVATHPDGSMSVAARFPAGSVLAGMVSTASNVVYLAAGGIDLTTGVTDPGTRGVYEVRPGR